MSNEYRDWLHDEILEYAHDKHRWQTRKYTNDPYIFHPMSVAKIIKEVISYLSSLFYMNTTDIYFLEECAYLHDVVEDTDTTLEEIEEKFGKQYSEIVYWLTDVSKPEDGNRKVRKQKDFEHICQAPIKAIIVKLADVYDNCKDIVDNDPAFAKKYLKEKDTFLKMLAEKRPMKNLYEQYDEYDFIYMILFKSVKKLIDKQLERIKNV